MSKQFKAAVFDWAGTMVDFGSFAPMGVFVEAFGKFGIEVSIAEAREPMGSPKWDHIKTMLEAPRIREAWKTVRGHEPTNSDVDEIYAVFVPMNETVVARYANLIPGAKETVDRLRAMGLKIGSTTGYTRSIMAKITPVAAQQGYVPDNIVCADDITEGRPGPLGMYQCFVDLAVYPPSAVIKVDDTVPGILEGVSAGCVTVGVAMSGNYVGKSLTELGTMSDSEVDFLRSNATQKLKEAGADYVIDTVKDLPDLIAQLERKAA